MTIRRTSASIAAGCVASLLALATPATAAENMNRVAVSFPPDEVVATCANGAEIGLGFDLIRNIHQYFDDAGNLVKESRNVTFTGIFENLSTGEQYTFRGTRHAVFDYVSGTFTMSGNSRTVTQPGHGAVLHSAGREVIDLVDDGVLFSSGPKIDEVSPGAAAGICGLFGLSA
jgi:hypothetical protein